MSTADATESTKEVGRGTTHRLRRWLPARLFGTTGFGWFWGGGILSIPFAVAADAFDIDIFTVGLLAFTLGWAWAEATAWAEVDGDAITWRALILTNRVPVAEVVDVDEWPIGYMPGAIMQLRLKLRDGRYRLIRSSTAVGNKARRDFENAIRAAAGLPPGPDVRLPDRRIDG